MMETTKRLTTTPALERGAVIGVEERPVPQRNPERSQIDEQIPVILRSTQQHVVIVGAGPYGLAAAAHLRAAGVEIRVFGEPMGFWQRQMPVGMLLRSPWEGSHIADPDRRLTLNHYLAAHRLVRPPLLPLTQFVAYGQWFQRQVVPDIDRRRVTLIEPTGDGFRLVLEDGAPISAQRVVVATGLAAFATRQAPFDDLPRTLVSHSSDHQDLSTFAGQRVLVIGAGQAALESAALLSEAGAAVEIIVRASAVRFLRQGTRRHAVLHSRANPLRKALFPPGDIGPPIMNWMIETPDLFRRLPPGLQQRIAKRGVRPAGAGWLKPRLHHVEITPGRSVVSALPASQGLHLMLDDGSVRDVDHVLLATGFRVDLADCPWLDSTLTRAVRRPDGYPELGAGFECAVPGLHFLGAPAAETFGPLMRFVAGTGYAARSLARHVTGAGHSPQHPLSGAERSYPDGSEVDA